jgi:acyl-CoA synthetase (AMP-forming)/AMP-acid ligase II
VVAAPMFHAWGFGQLILGTMLSCTLVVRRTFDAVATMALVDRYRATGLSVAPVMLDRIMELPDEVRNQFSGRSLRFVSAAGSRMRPDVVVRFMDQFGDVIREDWLPQTTARTPYRAVVTRLSPPPHSAVKRFARSVSS